MAMVSPVAPALYYRAVLRDGLSDIMGQKGAVVAFICNHCPYVIDVPARTA
jgi:hypothetical protein